MDAKNDIPDAMTIAPTTEGNWRYILPNSRNGNGRKISGVVWMLTASGPSRKSRRKEERTNDDERVHGVRETVPCITENMQ